MPIDVQLLNGNAHPHLIFACIYSTAEQEIRSWNITSPREHTLVQQCLLTMQIKWLSLNTGLSDLVHNLLVKLV